METPLLLSLGKRLECRKGESTLKGKEGRRWGTLNVCVRVCVQECKNKGSMRRTDEYPDIYEDKRKNAEDYLLNRRQVEKKAKKKKYKMVIK